MPPWAREGCLIPAPGKRQGKEKEETLATLGRRGTSSSCTRKKTGKRKEGDPCHLGQGTGAYFLHQEKTGKRKRRPLPPWAREGSLVPAPGKRQGKEKEETLATLGKRDV